MFEPKTWATPQTLSVAAVPDGTDEYDPHMSSIAFSVSSADPNYNGLSVPSLMATIGDADALLVTIHGPAAGVPGQPATFEAVVNAGGIGAITYDWTTYYQGNEVATGDQATYLFNPDVAGGYNIQVIVGDSQGQNPATFTHYKALGDVSTSIFVDDIVWLAELGVTKGCNPPDNDLFCPTATVTRGQMSAFLARFLGLTDGGAGNHFSDDDGSIFEANIELLVTAGITNGCNPPINDKFCPDKAATRGQLAAFLVRAMDLSDVGADPFTDDDGSIFEADIAALAAAGITQGCNPPHNTLFCPNDSVTRGQMAAFLHRADRILSP
jgi:hypothetical protein